jgi:polyhydroxyalkanoate synthase
VPIDLSKVKVPAYFISTAEDHIAPWKSTYIGSTYLGSPVRFVLGGSGHIAGIVNPPAAKKYHYWTNESNPETPEEWFSTATQHPGSWWEDWQSWIHARNEAAAEAESTAIRVAARVPGDGGLKVLEDGPGSYVTLRLGKSAS